MKKQQILAAIALSASLVLASCATPVTEQALPQITFAHLTSLNFAVEAVEVDNRYQAPNQDIYIENRFSTPPAAAVRTWAIERLKPVGGSGSGILRVVIKQASVQEHDLKLDKSFKGTFTRQQSNRYDLTIDVALEIIDGSGKSVAFSAAKVSRSITTGEDISLNDREKRWFEMTEKAMADFNLEIEKNIRQYLVNWLR